MNCFNAGNNGLDGEFAPIIKASALGKYLSLTAQTRYLPKES